MILASIASLIRYKVRSLLKLHRWQAGFLSLLFLGLSVQAQEIFNISTVVRMQRAGMSDDLIADAILNAQRPTLKFDTSPDGLITLKQAGFSEKLIDAIIKRSSPSAASVDQTATNTPRAASVLQNGQSIPLTPTLASTIFAPGKGNDPMRSLGALGNIGIDAATGAAAASAGLGSAVPIAGLGVAGWDLYRIRSVKGFSFETLPSVSSRNGLAASAPIDIAIPLEIFDDSHYSTAQPLVLRLTTSPETQARVLGTARAEYRYSAMTGPKSKTPVLLEAYRHTVINVEPALHDNVLTLHLAELGRGEYAIAFATSGNLLPLVLDFSVR